MIGLMGGTATLDEPVVELAIGDGMPKSVFFCGDPLPPSDSSTRSGLGRPNRVLFCWVDESPTFPLSGSAAPHPGQREVPTGLVRLQAAQRIIAVTTRLNLFGTRTLCTGANSRQTISLEFGRAPAVSQ